MKKNLILGLFTVAVVVCFSYVSEAQTLRERLDQYETGHTDSGLILEPKMNIVLVSVHFPNNGYEDTVKLTDSTGTIVYFQENIVSDPDADIVINLPLYPGNKYYLTSETPGNRKFRSFTAWPKSNIQISVVGGILGGVATDQFWFAFDEIKTIRVR